MTEQDQKQNTDDNVEELHTEDETVEVNEELAELAKDTDDIDALSQEAFEALKAENDKLQDQMLRAVAETENIRRRAERDKGDAIKFGVSKFAKPLLGVADNLMRALQSVPEDAIEGNEALSNLMEGVDATQKELIKALSNMGIEPIIVEEGQKFDPNLHEVMFEAPHDEYDAGQIVQIVEDGYTIHGRLLRPARVGVAKKNADTAVDMKA